MHRRDAEHPYVCHIPAPGMPTSAARTTRTAVPTGAAVKWSSGVSAITPGLWRVPRRSVAPRATGAAIASAPAVATASSVAAISTVTARHAIAREGDVADAQGARVVNGAAPGPATVPARASDAPERAILARLRRQVDRSAPFAHSVASGRFVAGEDVVRERYRWDRRCRRRGSEGQ